MIGQRFFRRLRARSAYAMLMVSYVGLLVFSMVFASVSYVRLYHSAQKRAEEQAYAQLRQAAYVINGYVESVRQSVMSFCMNEHVTSFIYTRAPLTSEDYYRMKQVISEVAGVCSANPYLDSLFLYVQDIDSVLGAYNRMSTEDYYAIYLSFADQSLEQWRNFLQNTAPDSFCAVAAVGQCRAWRGGCLYGRRAPGRCVCRERTAGKRRHRGGRARRAGVRLGQRGFHRPRLA